METFPCNSSKQRLAYVPQQQARVPPISPSRNALRYALRSNRILLVITNRLVSHRSQSVGVNPKLKIARIFAHRIDLPLVEGSYKWSGGKSVSVFDSTLVGVETDGA